MREDNHTRCNRQILSSIKIKKQNHSKILIWSTHTFGKTAGSLRLPVKSVKMKKESEREKRREDIN